MCVYLFMFIYQYLHINISLNVSINFCLRIIFVSAYAFSGLCVCVCVCCAAHIVRLLFFSLSSFAIRLSTSFVSALHRCTSHSIINQNVLVRVRCAIIFLPTPPPPSYIGIQTHFIICFAVDEKNNRLSFFSLWIWWWHITISHCVPWHTPNNIVPIHMNKITKAFKWLYLLLL